MVLRTRGKKLHPLLLLRVEVNQVTKERLLIILVCSEMIRTEHACLWGAFKCICFDCEFQKLQPHFRFLSPSSAAHENLSQKVPKFI